MKYILIATNDESAISTIQECLEGEYVVETASDCDTCLEKFRKKRFEFIFIDVTFLIDVEQKDLADFSEALTPFWNTFPTAQIIIMSSQGEIRKAVKMIKAGRRTILLTR